MRGETHGPGSLMSEIRRRETGSTERLRAEDFRLVIHLSTVVHVEKGRRVIPEQNRFPDDEVYRIGSAWHEELRAYFPEQPTSALVGKFANQGLCVNKSDEWDCDKPGVREDPATTARRVFPSVVACRSCPMFEDCAVLVSLDRTPHGVYAGEFYDSSSPKKQADVRAELNRVRQIRGVK